MINMFILIVVTHVNSGNVVSMQDFSSLEKCNKAKEIIISGHDKDYFITKIECIEK
jgi:hypothetical protein